MKTCFGKRTHIIALRFEENWGTSESFSDLNYFFGKSSAGSGQWTDKRFKIGDTFFPDTKRRI